jgi:hypothetical protein
MRVLRIAGPVWKGINLNLALYSIYYFISNCCLIHYSSHIIQIIIREKRMADENVYIQNHPLYWIICPIIHKDVSEKLHPSVHLVFTIQCISWGFPWDLY